MTSSELPLSSFERFRTSDLGEARQGAESLLSYHRIEPLERQAKLDVRYNAVQLVDTRIICAQYGAAVALNPGTLDNFYLVSMPLEGTSLLRHGNSEIVMHPDLASVQSHAGFARSEWHRGCRKLSIKMNRAAVDRCLGHWLGRAPTQPVVFDLGLDLRGHAGASWKRLMHFLIQELSSDSVYLSSTTARRGLDELLINTLLFAQRHNYSEALHADTPVQPRHLRRVEEHVLDDPGAPHTLASMAAQAGVGVRSLQTSFQRYRGTTPTAFVRSLRLQKARELLSAPAGSGTVTDIALDVGYTHLGRFAIDYKKRFGESPSQTLARTRSAG
jgi:AraC-like DNA-binding protein